MIICIKSSQTYRCKQVTRDTNSWKNYKKTKEVTIIKEN